MFEDKKINVLLTIKAAHEKLKSQKINDYTIADVVWDLTIDESYLKDLADRGYIILNGRNFKMNDNIIKIYDEIFKNDESVEISNILPHLENSLEKIKNIIKKAS